MTATIFSRKALDIHCRPPAIKVGSSEDGENGEAVVEHGVEKRAKASLSVEFEVQQQHDDQQQQNGKVGRHDAGSQNRRVGLTQDVVR